MPLKWANVTGVSTNAGSGSLKDAGSLFGKAFDKFEGIAREKQTDLESTNTALALDELRGLNTVEDFDAAEGASSIDALNQRFGAGNFNAESISKFRDTARQNILNQSNKDADRELKLIDDVTARENKAQSFKNSQKLFQQDQANKEGRKAAIIQAENIPTLFESGKANDAAHDRAIAQFEKEFPDRKGAITRDQFGKINFKQDSNITAEEITQFTEIAKGEGFTKIPSFQQASAQLDTNLKDIPAEFRNFAREQFATRYNKSTLTKNEQATVASFKLSTISSRDAQIESEKANELDLLKTVNAIKSPEQTALDKEKLTPYLLNLFPESHANFLGIGNQEGGTELVNKVHEILANGIVDEKGVRREVEPYMIYGVLGEAGDFEDEWLDNASVDLTDLESALLREVKKGAKGTVLAKRRAIRVETNENIRKLTNKATSDNATYERKFKQERHVVSSTRNSQLYSEVLQQALARAKR